MVSKVHTMTDWLKRPYCPDTDEDVVVSMWLTSHLRDGARGRRLRRVIDGDAETEAYRPAVHTLLRFASCDVLCDPTTDGTEPIVWAWACFDLEPTPALHYVAVKKSAHEDGDYKLAAEMVTELLRPLHVCKVPVGLTAEIPLLNRPEMKALGAGRRDGWYVDDTFFARTFTTLRKPA